MTDDWWWRKIDDEPAEPMTLKQLLEAVDRHERENGERWQAWARGEGPYPEPIIVSPALYEQLTGRRVRFTKPNDA